MCLAAKTPSTIAQQKAATTPKLMKTMEATNWKWGGGQKRVSIIVLHRPGVFVPQQSQHAASVLCLHHQRARRRTNAWLFHQDTGSAAGFSSPRLTPFSFF